MKTTIALAVGVAALLALWRWTPLATVADPAWLAEHARGLRAAGAATALAPVAFLALGLALVPLVVLRLATVVAFGPVLGPLYAIAGVALCAWAGHAIGARVGAARLERVARGRVERLRAALDRRGGVLAIAALRLVPLGPFMIVNAAAGAARLRRGTFVLGTVLGLMPGLVVVTVLAAQLEAHL